MRKAASLAESIVLCPICDDGPVSEKLTHNDVVYKNQPHRIKLLYNVCSACGSEYTNAKQSSLNKEEMLNLKERVDSVVKKFNIGSFWESRDKSITLKIIDTYKDFLICKVVMTDEEHSDSLGTTLYYLYDSFEWNSYPHDWDLEKEITKEDMLQELTDIANNMDYE